MYVLIKHKGLIAKRKMFKGWFSLLYIFNKS